MKSMRCLIVAAAALASSSAYAQITDGVVKIGVLTDMSSLYADLAGAGSVAAAKIAVADFDPAAKGMKVEIVFGDHQNKPDIGGDPRNSWYRRRQGRRDRRRRRIPASALATSEVGKLRRTSRCWYRAPASSDLTGTKCNADTIHWVYDTWNLANGTGKAVVKTGGNTWFFLTADYAFGQALERDTSAVVEANGGKVRRQGAACRSTPATSPRSCCRRRRRKAKIIGLANAGGDTINSIKQAAEFGIVRAASRSPGSWCSRATSPRSACRRRKAWCSPRPGTGTSTTRAAPGPSAGRRSGPARFRPWCMPASIPRSFIISRRWRRSKPTATASAVVAKMKELPTDDPLFGKGIVRADGREIHDAYLFEVKKPAESKYPGDFYKPAPLSPPPRPSARSRKAAARWSSADCIVSLPERGGQGWGSCRGT